MGVDQSELVDRIVEELMPLAEDNVTWWSRKDEGQPGYEARKEHLRSLAQESFKKNASRLVTALGCVSMGGDDWDGVGYACFSIWQSKVVTCSPEGKGEYKALEGTADTDMLKLPFIRAIFDSAVNAMKKNGLNVPELPPALAQTVTVPKP